MWVAKRGGVFTSGSLLRAAGPATVLSHKCDMPLLVGGLPKLRATLLDSTVSVLKLCGWHHFTDSSRSPSKLLLSGDSSLGIDTPQQPGFSACFVGYCWDQTYNGSRKMFSGTHSQNLLILLQHRPCLELIIVSSSFQALFFLQARLLELV